MSNQHVVEVLSGVRPEGSFVCPDITHFPAAYWFWHRLPTPDEIYRQVREMYDGGYRTFLIQARLAFPQHDYLSERYLAACRMAVKEAKTLGMQVGIYDEYSWQSGLAGGRTVTGANHLRERHIFWATGTVAFGECSLWIRNIHCSVETMGNAGMNWQYEGGAIHWDEWEVVGALAYSKNGDEAKDVEDVTASARIGFWSDSQCRIDVSIPVPHCREKVVTVFVAARCASSRVPNYLLKETALRFIEVGYEPFRAALCDDFGETVKYFFFDQPHATFYHWDSHHGNLLTSLPFTPELIEKVESATGRSFAFALLTLVINTGPLTGALRAQFYEVFSGLVRDSFLGTLRAWTEKQGLLLAGHEVLGHVGSWHLHGAFGNWDLRVNFGLDYFGVDAYRGMTCVDAEGNVPQLSAKMGDSVSQSHGRSGCTVEQYFVGPSSGQGSFAGMWGLTLESLRAQILRLYLTGAKQFIFHAFYQSDGNPDDWSVLKNPRFDFAPGINYEPWWPFHSAFAEECARLSTFVGCAEPVCEVAILYPLRTAWAEGPTHSYGDHVAFWAELLTERGYGFHFIDERNLLRARMEDKFLAIGEREYGCLILPSITTLHKAESLEKIEQFLACGGTVIASGDTPVRYQQREVAKADEDWKTMALRYRQLLSFTEIPSKAEADALLGPFAAGRPLIDSEGDLWQWIGKDEFGWRLAIFNDSKDSVSAVVELPFVLDKIEIWDAFTGEIRQMEATPTRRIEISLHPMELCCLRICGEVSPDIKVDKVAIGQTISPESSDVAERIALDEGWSLSLEQDGKTVIVPIEVCVGWEEQSFSNVSGVGTYDCSFDLDNFTGDWQLYLPEVHTAVTAELNGVEIGRRGWSPYLFRIPEGLLREKQNRLRLRVYNTAANVYLADTPYQLGAEPSGLCAIPFLLHYQG